MNTLRSLGRVLKHRLHEIDRAIIATQCPREMNFLVKAHLAIRRMLKLFCDVTQK